MIPIVILKLASPMTWASKAIKGLGMVMKSPVVGRATNAAAHTAKPGFMSSPLKVFGTVGAGAGAIGSVKKQNKAIASGEQQQFDWGRMARSTALGAATGMTASGIKPLNKAWKWSTKTNPLSAAESAAFMKSNPMYVNQFLNRPKFLSNQYFKQIATDFRHPWQSMKSQWKNVTHGYTGDMANGFNIHKRSPLGIGAAATFGVGLPAKYIYDAATTKDQSPGERATRALTSAGSLITPYALPSMLMMESPSLFYRGKKPAQPGAQIQEQVQQ